MAGLLRVDPETEESGNDIPKHGESAYPADAWVEMQYRKNIKEGGGATGMPPNMSGHSNGAFEMGIPEMDKAANNLSNANGGVEQKWRKNYVPYEEAGGASDK